MSASGAAAYLSSEALRRGLSRRKVLDQVFVIVGLIVMLMCLAVLAVLFIDLVRDGAPRFGWGFFTNLTSRPTSVPISSTSSSESDCVAVRI